eukprot:CAMPEP_0202459388 /NCGR_PEP_ID=MMETSP1360-20130828/35203_1 /ASSEMBLY_ACC=CAM_ASM_000848 /TAXON_ID=515479 /ORGANISM="Licmophora paradoxa, Strain CCMP2313" /LENGTH=249 /DNA_ID=CAMNT_0049080439 /DNA_START=104 /DNA_END=853 /DNA_ORIENTATION=+
MSTTTTDANNTTDAPAPAPAPAPDASSTAVDKIRQEKKILRKEIRRKVKEVSDDDVKEQSNEVWERVKKTEPYKSSKTIGMFLSMPKNEIYTYGWIEEALKEEKILFVPHVGSNFEEPDMEMFECPRRGKFYEEWPKNKWKIPEPPSEDREKLAKAGDLDLILVPGLAFDRQGHRCGQGKGYYDRFLAKMFEGDTTKKPTLMAVCLEAQLLGDGDTIPTHEHDFTMEFIVTPKEIIECKRGTKRKSSDD